MAILVTDHTDQQGSEPPARARVDGRPPWHHLRGWFTWRSLVAGILVVIAVEASFRVVETRNGVHGPQPDVVDEHAERLRTEQPDLVVVGSSSAGSQIWVPTLEDDRVACRAYNAWLASPTMLDIERYVRDEVLVAAAPETVILGITMREFNAGSTTYANPELDAWLDSQEGPSNVWESMSENLAILRSREILQDPYRFGNTVLGRIRPLSGPDGHHLPSLDQVIADEPEGHRAQEQDEMRDYHLSDDDLDAFRSTLQLLSERDISTVVVELPVSDVFIEMAPGGQADYQQYRTAIERVVTEVGVPFVDGASFDLVEARDFADVNHLNRDGSRRFTDLLVDALPVDLRRSC